MNTVITVNFSNVDVSMRSSSARPKHCADHNDRTLQIEKDIVVLCIVVQQCAFLLPSQSLLKTWFQSGINHYHPDYSLDSLFDYYREPKPRYN